MFRPIYRPIYRAIASTLVNRPGGFNPASLFADGSKGVVYDNNDLSSFYLDSAGTTAATVNGLVGLQLDKSAGLVLGAELTVNGDFASDTVWSKAATATISGGVHTFTAAGSGDVTTQVVAYVLSIPRTYQVTFTVSGFVSGSVAIKVGASIGVTASANGTYTCLIQSAATNNLVEIQSRSAGTTLSVDNVSVKELPGNHRYQTTTGSKPVLRGTPTGANLVTNGDFASGTGWTTGAGWAIGSGVATATTSSGTLTSTLTATIAKVYRLTYTVTRSAGSVQPSFGGVTGASRSAAGTYVEYLTASSTAALVFTGTTFSGTVDNIEVVDVSAGSVTAPYGLQCDGVDDFMQTAAVDFTATDKMFVCAGVRRLGTTGTNVLAELSASTDTTNGSFVVFAPYAGFGQGSVVAVRGTVSAGYQDTADTGMIAPSTYVSSVSFNTAGVGASAQMIQKINGVSRSFSATNTATTAGNFGNHALYFGRRGGASLPYNGLDFGMVIVGKTLTSTQISQTERYIAQRTGIAL